MRQLAPVLLLGLALTAGAAEIWRWTDANGVVHYSDQPHPGAQRVTVDPQGPVGTVPVTEAESQVAPRRPRPAPFAYVRCEVGSPGSDETFHGVQPVFVSLDVEPALQRGHRVEVTLDGTRLADWPEVALNFTVPEVFRGSHTLQVRILDAGGAVLCTGQPLTFHLRQQSALAPGRAGSKPPPRPAPPTPKPPPAN